MGADKDLEGKLVHLGLLQPRTLLKIFPSGFSCPSLSSVQILSLLRDSINFMVLLGGLGLELLTRRRNTIFIQKFTTHSGVYMRDVTKPQLQLFPTGTDDPKLLTQDSCLWAYVEDISSLMHKNVDTAGKMKDLENRVGPGL